MENRYYTSRAPADGFPNYSVDSIRDEPRMVGGERQRAYRYGMTLLCVGALFNWLGISEGGNSDPIKFIGYTCLASGALLICMAICFWANSGTTAHPRHQGRHGLTGAQRDMVVSIVEGRRMQREKPPDYDAVADLSPPPSYDDAIRLSPAFLIPAASQGTTMGERAPEYSVSCTVVNETEQQPQQTITGVQTGGQEQPADGTVDSKPDPEPDSPLTRVIRMSSRFLRRTLSNVDRRAGEGEASDSPPVRRTSSYQDLKNT